MRIEKLMMSVEEQAAMELANAKAEQNQADADYIAMMTDVELPRNEEVQNEQEV